IHDYWKSLVPTDVQFQALDIPVLSITGAYDTTQWGAIEFYRRHTRNASPAARSNHYLVIGPWDHAATRVPRPVIGGLPLGEESLVDIPRLHFDWYEWVLKGADKPAFLRNNVAYYVSGAETWRYADTLDQATAERQAWYLGSKGKA